ncbi:MAG: hypothetical protein ACYDAO_07465 [Thermoplasmataceae archaeon]
MKPSEKSKFSVKLHQIIGNLSNRKKVAFAIISVAIMVFGSFFAFIYVNGTSGESYHNPNISLTIGFINNTSAVQTALISNSQNHRTPLGLYDYNLSNITIQVFGTMPSLEGLGSTIVNLSSSSELNNSAYVELFNYTGHLKSNHIKGSLSHMFRSIINQYRKIYHNFWNKNMNISLSIDASYYYVSNLHMYIYRYYNNMPFNPWNKGFNENRNPYSFNERVLFNMNQNPIIIPINKSKTFREIGPGGGSTRCIPVWVPFSVSTFWGPLPQLIVQEPLDSGFSLAFNTGNFTGNFSTTIDSVKAVSPESGQISGAVTSACQSWGTGSASFSFHNNDGSSNPTVNHTIGVIALAHVEYQITLSRLYLNWYSGDTFLGSVKTTYKSTTFKVDNINNGSFEYESGYLPILYGMNITEAGYNWSAFFDSGLQVDNSYTISSGQTLNNINYTFQSSTFKTATGSAETTGLSQVGIAVAGLGIGIAIAAIVFAPETAGVSLAALGIGVSEIGVGMSEIQQTMNVPLFVTDQKQEINFLGFANQNYGSYAGDVILNTYQYSGTESMGFGNSYYTVNMPSPVVVGVQS